MEFDWCFTFLRTKNVNRKKDKVVMMKIEGVNQPAERR